MIDGKFKGRIEGRIPLEFAEEQKGQIKVSKDSFLDMTYVDVELVRERIILPHICRKDHFTVMTVVLAPDLTTNVIVEAFGQGSKGSLVFYGCEIISEEPFDLEEHADLIAVGGSMILDPGWMQ